MVDLGILAPDSIARRVNRETFLLLGGTAALLLQVAHPQVAAGVDGHSDFRRDPLGRLLRTLNTTLAIVYGTTPQARAALRRIDRRHQSVRGQTAGGRPYAADDPALVAWIQVTLVLTSLRLYEAVLGRLSDEERDRYWSEARAVAMALGATDAALPRGYAGVLRYEHEMLAHEAIPDATAVAVAGAVLRPLPWLPGAAIWPLEALTAGLLPRPIRAALGLRWRSRDRCAHRFIVVALRWLVPALPRRLRFVPQARAYDARTRRSDASPPPRRPARPGRDPVPHGGGHPRDSR